MLYSGVAGKENRRITCKSSTAHNLAENYHKYVYREGHSKMTVDEIASIASLPETETY